MTWARRSRLRKWHDPVDNVLYIEKTDHVVGFFMDDYDTRVCILTSLPMMYNTLT